MWICALILSVVAAACPLEPPTGGPDTTAPVLTLPDDFAVPATEPDGAQVTWDATANDAVDGAVPVTCAPEPGLFLPGDTDVTCTATDNAGNTATGSFTVTVTVDTTPPVISIPSGISAEATGPEGADVTWFADAVDDVDGQVMVECGPELGVFPLGETVITCTAVDNAGNEASANFTITVYDATAPVLSLPEEVLVSAPDPSGAAVDWTASATDLVDGDVVVTCVPAPGQFPVGATPVSCSAVDSAGNTSTGGFTVTVDFVDDAPPTITLPTGITAEATGPDGADVDWTATAFDDADGAVDVDCSEEPGTFPLGDTDVTCTATDAAGNEATAGFTISVVDTTAPALSLPTGIDTDADELGLADVTWTATATDLVDGTVPVTCTPGPGEFPVGATTVNCTATDAAGNDADGAFSITVTAIMPTPKIANGNGHSCAITDGGEVECWGANTYGKLGNGTTTDSNVPVTVVGISDAVAVTAGNGHSCALLGTGGVRCWGLAGTLGDGSTASSSVPVAVAGISTAVGLAAGFSHTCAVLADGTVTCWGDGGDGQLGNGATTNATVPVDVVGITDAVGVTGGWDHSCAALADGTARCWGNDSYGQLGNGSAGNTAVPLPVSGLNGVFAIGAGWYHTCAIEAGGDMRCWGRNTTGTLGNGTTDPSQVPVAVTGLTGAVGVSAAFDHSCAVRSDGTARCWGDNTYGRLGDGTTTNSTVPVTVTVPGDVLDLSAGGTHTCATTADDGVRCWGRNDVGQLGNGTTGRRTTVPIEVPLPAGAAHVSTSGTHTCVTLVVGTVRCWGRNLEGQLGTGAISAGSNVPVEIPGLSGVVETTAGERHSCARIDDGTVKCWGNNTYSQLGIGTTGGSSLVPVTVSGLTDVVAITGSNRHTCALIDDGTVRCWGGNSSGQLGNGTSGGSSNLPVTATGLSDVVEVSADSNHTCATRSDRTVRCWGYNFYGQLGNGTSGGSSTTPVTVTGITTALSATTASFSTCAVLADSTARCWGRNEDGQLGNGTTTPSNSPVVVSGLTGATVLAGGTQHVCALLSDQTLRCWGYNTYGQLGNGTRTNSSTPVAVAGLTDVVGVAAGFSHTCAIVEDGGVWCWGESTEGQVGMGTEWSTTPVPVVGFE